MNIVASDREGGVKRNLIREELMIRREGGGMSTDRGEA